MLGLREYYYLLPTMDPSTVPVPAEESPGNHLGTSSRLDRPNLEELIRNVLHREIASHSSGVAGASHSGGEFRDGYPIPPYLPREFGASRPLRG